MAREADPDDARGAWIRLTPDGVALAERAVRVNSAAHAEVFAGVPVEVIDRAAAALREVTAATARPSSRAPARAPRAPSPT